MSEAKLEQQKAREEDIDLAGGEGESEEEGQDILGVSKGEDFYRAQYALDGKPNFFDFKVHMFAKIEDMNLRTVENDYYLHGLPNNVIFAGSQKHLAKRFANYARRSAYDLKTRSLTPFVEKYIPTHGLTEGGKGLAMNNRPVVSHIAGMSSLVNFSLGSGCSAQCVPVESDVNLVEMADGSRVSHKEILRLFTETEKDIWLRDPQDGGMLYVKHAQITGEKEVCLWTTSNGRQVECTRDHQFWTLLSTGMGKMTIQEIYELRLPLVMAVGQLSIDEQASLSEIVSCEPQGVKQVMDIEVDSENHIYLVNGIAISNCSFCFPEESDHNFVTTHEGERVKLQDVKVGDMIRSHDGQGFTKVLRRDKTGVKPVYRYTTEDGTVVECTPDHPTLCYSEEQGFFIVPAQVAYTRALFIIKNTGA